MRVVPLSNGDRVAIVAPASPVDGKLLDAGIKVIEGWGLRVECSDTILMKDGYLAGRDDRRAREINHFIEREDIRAIFVARGGYGILRILDRIDFEALLKDPKFLVGYSDSTALLAYISTRFGLPSLHGCMPATEAVLEDNICHTGLLMGILKDEVSYPFRLWHDLAGPGHGVAVRGKLFGGNLSVLCSLMGTPYEPEFEGNILFLEEVDEKAYRVDRKLTQLRLSGLLGRVSAVVKGRFVPVAGGSSDLLDQIIAGTCRDAGVPLFRNFPAGHGGENMPLPFGVMAEITEGEGKAALTVLQSPFGM